MYVQFGPSSFIHLWFKWCWYAEEAVNRADALLFLTISGSTSAIRCLLPRYSDLCRSCERVCFYTVEHDISTYTCIPGEEKGRRRQCVHTNTLTHFTEAVGEPECRAWGLLCLWCFYCLLCCPSACRRLLHTYASVQPCIINSDCCGQQVTVQESCKTMWREEEVWIEGDQKKRSLSIPFLPIFVHIVLSSLFGLCFDPLSSNLCPHGSPAVRQPEEGAASLLILSSLTFRHLGYTSFCTQGIIWEP